VRPVHALLGLALLLPGAAEAQQATRTQPVEGIRETPATFHALTGARVVTAPGQVVDNATIVIRNGIIQSVAGTGRLPPAPGSGT
jgi:hypothetical protein